MLKNMASQRYAYLMKIKVCYIHLWRNSKFGPRFTVFMPILIHFAGQPWLRYAAKNFSAIVRAVVSTVARVVAGCECNYTS